MQNHAPLGGTVLFNFVQSVLENCTILLYPYRLSASPWCHTENRLGLPVGALEGLGLAVGALEGLRLAVGALEGLGLAVGATEGLGLAVGALEGRGLAVS
jgi:hypothetical protein